MVIKTLSGLRPGETAVVQRLNTPDETSFKLLELGIGPGESITFLREAPFGGPIEIELMGYRLSIRRSDGDQILVDTAPLLK